MSGLVSSSPGGTLRMSLRSTSRTSLLSPALGRPDLTRSSTNSPWAKFLEPSLFSASLRSTSASRHVISNDEDQDSTKAHTGIKREQDVTGVYTLQNESNPFEQSFSTSRPESEVGFSQQQQQQTISMDEIEPPTRTNEQDDNNIAPRDMLSRRTSSSRSSSSAVDHLSAFSGSTSGTELTNVSNSNENKRNRKAARAPVETSSLARLREQLASSQASASRVHYQPAPAAMTYNGHISTTTTIPFNTDSSSSITTLCSIDSTSTNRSNGARQPSNSLVFTTLQEGLPGMTPSTTALSDIQVGFEGGTTPSFLSGSQAGGSVRTSGRKRKNRSSFDQHDVTSGHIVIEEEFDELDPEDDLDTIISPRKQTKRARGSKLNTLVETLPKSKLDYGNISMTGDSVTSEIEMTSLGEPGQKFEGKAAALERNRLAAIRSRQKKKERVDGLQQAVTTLTTSNAQMQAQALQLYDEVQQLRQMLSAIHPEQDCQCKHVQGYLVRERKGQGIPLIEQLAGDVLTRAFVPGVTDEVTVQPTSRDGDQVEKWREQVRREKEDMERKGKKVTLVDEQHAIPIKRNRRN
ncbi:hypothetical protein OIO90_004274 [Microbotryomycetes sp. JL221]|nr:hypothetical protein OIO90_004274 [Microbotryomycetes sp. JL221]